MHNGLHKLYPASNIIINTIKSMMMKWWDMHNTWVRCSVPSNLFLQLRGPATAVSIEFSRDLTAARHFKKFFCNMHNKNIYNGNRKIPAARQQFSVRASICYFTAAHPHSLEGTLVRWGMVNKIWSDNLKGRYWKTQVWVGVYKKYGGEKCVDWI
jgi:hypothetical protein